MKNRNFLTGGEMRTPVIFYAAKPIDDFLPGETFDDVIYKCFADVYAPSTKDLSMTDNKASVTLVTLFPVGVDITDNMYFEIALPRYKGIKYNIIQIDDDTNDHKNIKVIGETYHER